MTKRILRAQAVVGSFCVLNVSFSNQSRTSVVSLSSVGGHQWLRLHNLLIEVIYCGLDAIGHVSEL